jgi:hypothetical protein
MEHLDGILGSVPGRRQPSNDPNANEILAPVKQGSMNEARSIEFATLRREPVSTTMNDSKYESKRPKGGAVRSDSFARRNARS